jgi:hypothetical protein
MAGSSNLIKAKSALKRSIRLTNFISITLFSLMVIVGLLFYVFEINETNRVTLLTLLLSPALLTPYILNRFGLTNLSRLVLPILLPIIITFLSIDGKVGLIQNNAISAINYFDIRLVLLSIALIPLVIFDFSQKKWLVAAYLPSTISILFYDPIHNYFNVGYYQANLLDPDYYFLANLFTSITFVFVTAVIAFLNYQVYKNENQQRSENKKLNTYLSELVRLSNFHAISHGEVVKAKIEILKSIKNCLNVSRVSIWLYNPEGQYIECEYLLDEDLTNRPNAKLFAKDYPNYINAIQKENLIIAHNAEEHIHTSEFTDSYLKPLDIKSMLDAPFMSKGNLGGVICCEQQHAVKVWGPAEIILLKGLTDLLTYTQLVEERENQNQLLQEKNSEISDINKGLEGTIKKRTRELQEKNTQLTEYAYINSHILRAPVARISGLYKLFLMETKTVLNDTNILHHMDTSIVELEEVTRQISRAIETHGTINREQL